MREIDASAGSTEVYGTATAVIVVGSVNVVQMDFIAARPVRESVCDRKAIAAVVRSEGLTERDAIATQAIKLVRVRRRGNRERERERESARKIDFMASVLDAQLLLLN